jgi:hypothetical protein
MRKPVIAIKAAVIFAATILFMTGCQKDDKVILTVDFESIDLPAEGFLSNENAGGAIVINGISFTADYNSEYQISSGTIISQLKDTVTAGYLNGYSAWPGSGASGSAKFAIINPTFGSTDPIISFSEATSVESVEVANNTYAALSMRNGDAFAKAFSYEDQDFFKVIFEGFDDQGNSTGTVEFFLADFRTAGAVGIRKNWTSVSLSGLGSVKSIGISFESSDVGTYGINTPLYVAIDHFKFEE